MIARGKAAQDHDKKTTPAQAVRSTIGRERQETVVRSLYGWYPVHRLAIWLAAKFCPATEGMTQNLRIAMRYVRFELVFFGLVYWV
jgi:hypothetical protein